MTFDIDNEAKTVHPILPEIQIKQPVLDEKQFSFMPDDANIDLKTVIKTCKVDVVKEVKADKNLYSVAGDNLKQAVTGTGSHRSPRLKTTKSCGNKGGRIMKKKKIYLCLPRC